MDDAGGRAYRDAMPEWLAIEVSDADVPASSWRRAYEDALTEAALTNGADSWEWHHTRWGVVLELGFDTDEHLERFRRLPVVRAALDAVPDPVLRAARVPGPRGRGRCVGAAPSAAETGRRRGLAAGSRAGRVRRQPPLRRRPGAGP